MSTLAGVSPARHPDPVEAQGPARPPAAPAAGEVGAAPESPVVPNPTLRLDPALGLVVLEFRTAHGKTETLPTERELAAYRNNGGRPAGELPGMADQQQPRPGIVGATPAVTTPATPAIAPKPTDTHR